MRLTPFAKLFITLVILGVLGYAGWHYYQQGTFERFGFAPRGGQGDEDAKAKAPWKGKEQERQALPSKKGHGRRIVVGVNDFGGAYAAVVANDGALPGPRSLFKKRGLDVEIRWIKGSKERLKAFDEGEVDIMLLTLDYFAGLVPQYREKGVELRAFMMADWSRGNCGIVARPKFRSIESLKDARIITTRHTPTHYLILSMLSRSNLKPNEIERVKSNLIFATKTPLAAQMFERGEGDAAGIWEPYLSQVTAGGKAHLLVSTETATNLIADVLFAKLDFVKEHEAELPEFLRAWFEGVKMLEADPEGSVKIIAKAFKQEESETKNVLAKIKPATFADNRDFFGLEVEEGAPYIRLFTEASRFWQREGWVKQPAAPEDVRYLKALEAVSKDYANERVKENFRFVAAKEKESAQPLLTKAMSIYFASGSDRLDPNAKRVIDSFAETLQVFQNAYIRVEGNTDNVGSRAANIALSKRRAMAVVDYLVQRYKVEPSRFIAVGNGPDKPIGDNKTEEGRELNRRTEFQIIPNR